jgi:hypothetical protein
VHQACLLPCTSILQNRRPREPPAQLWLQLPRARLLHLCRLVLVASLLLRHRVAACCMRLLQQQQVCWHTQQRRQRLLRRLLRHLRHALLLPCRRTGLLRARRWMCLTMLLFRWWLMNRAM